MWCVDKIVPEDCFETNMQSLKVNTVLKTIKLTRTDLPPLTPHIISKCRDITVCADIIKVSGVRLFMLIFKNNYFTPQSTAIMVR